MLSQNNNALGIIFPNSYDNTVPELVTERAMASIPFAGRYRMVDFMLSSMANCGISNVSIVVRKNYHSLMDHLGTGREWDMARRHGGLNIVPPFAEKGVRIYSGRVEALGSILSYLENQKEKYVVMSDANIAINYDFNALLAAHQASGADVTIAYQKTEIPEGRKNDNYTLTVDADGRVTGIVIRDANNNNEYIQLNASKGVILATGDNSGDEKILRHFAPEVLDKKIANMGAMGMLGVDVEGKTVETGDGLRMGAWIGAKVQDFHAPMTHHMGSGMGVTPFLQLNKRGERFMNECIPGQQLENQIELQPECTSFQLYDANWGQQIPYMPANHGGLCYIIPEDEDESNPNFSDRQYTKISAKAEAYQFKADTLEDLLTQCGFEGQALDNALASIQRYNELCRAGSDDDFGKPASRMFPLENPPYYACQWGTTAMLVCVGGLESDENCHTFTEGDPASPKRDVIPGLYVCGNVQGSRYAVEYPICMRGISHSLCVYYGYVAGKNCVAGL